jgi:hypothetical protein
MIHHYTLKGKYPWLLARRQVLNLELRTHIALSMKEYWKRSLEMMSNVDK